MSPPPQRSSAPASSGRFVPPPTVDDIADKIKAISAGSEPQTPSPGIAWRRGEQGRRTPQTSVSSTDEEEGDGGGSRELTKEEREIYRFERVGRKKDYVHFEMVGGRRINVLQGLELHTGVFSAAEQKRIVDHVYELQEMGRKGQLRDRTYSEPKKWMRGKGRVTIQFGCCYNYATDRYGNPPGIIRDEDVDPLPHLLKTMIKRMVAWHVLPPTCIPNSCIINIYDKDDCIPPHIDHHDFVRPFCTVSFLSECKILFGTELKILGPGDFSGSMAIPLPVGSVLILNGNGADVAKHCVPAVPSKRISITFRKMDQSKHPYMFKVDPELQNLRPLSYPPSKSPVVQLRSQLSPPQQQGQFHTPPSRAQAHKSPESQYSTRLWKDLRETGQEKGKSASPFQLGENEFPPLGSSSGGGRTSKPARPLRQ